MIILQKPRETVAFKAQKQTGHFTGNITGILYPQNNGEFPARRRMEQEEKSTHLDDMLLEVVLAS
jgi:hypothetical protein